MECPICASSFNKGNRTEVQCFSCSYIACKDCVRTFITASNHLPKCMNCNVLFTTSFMVRNLSRSWVNTYKGQLSQILIGIELGKLPETQPYVEAEIHRQRIISENLLHEKELRILKDKVLALSTTIRINKYLIHGEPIPAHFGVTETPITPKQLIMQCPLDCRGFLSSQYKCGTCEKQVCSECIMFKDSDHVCIEEHKLSAELIKRESKACPKCGARICKIDGCDQMFCTSQMDGVHCGTAFSWKTGKIETGTIHNPHYYELARKGIAITRNIGDVQCGGVPPIHNVLIYLLSMNRDVERNNLIKIHRRICEIVQYTTRDFRATLQSHESTMRDLRVKYMMRTVDKPLFAELVYKAKRDHEKNQEQHPILELMTICGIETFHKINDMYEHTMYNTEPLEYLSSVREYCNEQLKELSITYNCSVNIMDAEFKSMCVKFNMNGLFEKSTAKTT